MQPLPTNESWPICTYAMIRQSEPIFVTPPPPAVPREIVTNSRIELPSPIATPVASPAYFKSCGAIPTQANEKIRLPLPIVVWPSRTTCETSSQFSPKTTCAPIVQYGPTVQLAGTTAPSATIAVG